MTFGERRAIDQRRLKQHRGTRNDDMTGREIQVVMLRPGEEVGANAVLLKYGVGREYTGGRCVRYRSRIAVSTVAERLESCAGGTAVPRRLQKQYARKQPLRSSSVEKARSLGKVG